MRRAVCMVAAGWLLAAAIAGCGVFGGEESAPSPAPDETSVVPADSSSSRLDPGSDLLLDFDDVPPRGMLKETVNLGTADIEVEGRSLSGAMLALEADPGGGLAVRFPPVSASPAVLAVTSTGVADVFSPGRASFRLGADVKLDAEAAAPADSEKAKQDNGNNVVQRGLFSDDAQFKLQVDEGRASCLMRGSRGEVLVKADTTVPAETWTRLACTRQEGRVTLTQEVLAGPGAGQQETWHSQDAIGPISMDRDAALAVGGKLNATGGVVTGNSDQFNGAIDNVVYDLID